MCYFHTKRKFHPAVPEAVLEWNRFALFFFLFLFLFVSLTFFLFYFVGVTRTFGIAPVIIDTSFLSSSLVTQTGNPSPA